MGNIKRFIYLIILGIIGIGNVYAFRPGGEVYEGDFDINRPITWHQAKAPYSKDKFIGCSGDYAECSCGSHVLAAMMIKAGIWGNGKSAVDAAKKSWDTGIMTFGPLYSFTDDNIKEFSGGKMSLVLWSVEHRNKQESYDIIKKEVEAGNYLWLAVDVRKTADNVEDYPNGGHGVLVDYIDDDGRIVVLDSGGRYKYLDDVGAGETDAIGSFRSSVRSSKEAPRFWEGENSTMAEDSDTSSSDRGDSSTRGDGESGYLDGIPDPIIDFKDGEDKIDRGKDKGLDTRKSFWDTLFGG